MSILNAILPKPPKPTKAARALVDTGRFHKTKRTHASKEADQQVRIYEIDHRSLERNAFAPWGRGKNTF